MLSSELLESNNASCKSSFQQHIQSEASLDLAISAWQNLLGNDRVLLHTLDYQKNTIDSHRQIPATLKLDSTSEIVKAIQIAQFCKIKVYPISTGNNWGYGCALPVTDDNVIFDLRSMKKIISFDASLGVVTVEPGVTQQDLYEFLQRYAPEFLVPVTGAGPDCSILGNALERGYGITPYTDHFAAVHSLKAVLPNGEIYQSYFSGTHGEEINQLHKWGIGPYLDGFFTQSNMGIVTEITLHLKKKPEAIEFFAFRIREDSQLELAVQVMRDILDAVGENLSGINLMNNNRLMSMATKYPFEKLNSDGSNRDAVFEEISRKYKITAWMGIGAIYGSRQVVKAVKQIIAKKLRKIDKLPIFINRKKLNLIKGFQRWLPFLNTDFVKHSVEKAESALNILEGIPHKVAIPLAYWKNISNPYIGHHIAHNPAKENCGLIWFTPLIPLRPQDLRSYAETVKYVCKKNKIEHLITLTTLSDKVVDSSIPILFNRKDLEDCHNAKACYLELYEECKKLGYQPYRMSVEHMDLLMKGASEYWSLVSKIKNAVDPAHILSPGRYCPLPGYSDFAEKSNGF